MVKGGGKLQDCRVLCAISSTQTFTFFTFTFMDRWMARKLNASAAFGGDIDIISTNPWPIGLEKITTNAEWCSKKVEHTSHYLHCMFYFFSAPACRNELYKIFYICSVF